MIDSTALGYFLRVIELGSINRAAENLNISQPTLSRALRLLEAAVGQQLFVRTPQGVHVTHSGELMLDLCKPIVAQLERLQHELSTDAGGRIAVGLPTSLNQPITIPFVRQMAERRPHTKLRIYEGINNSLRQWMEQGLLDFAIIISLERVPEHFDSTPLISDSLKLVGRNLEHLEASGPVGLTELSKLSMILPGRPNLIRAMVENRMQRAGLNLRYTIEAEMPSSCLDLARAGLGSTILPGSGLYGKDLKGLQVCSIDGFGFVWSLCVSRARRHSRLLTTVVDEFRQIVRDRVSAGEWHGVHLSKHTSMAE
jgi:LysR family transcriptional regulator, nitrogen assimilation regulatory protein